MFTFQFTVSDARELAALNAAMARDNAAWPEDERVEDLTAYLTKIRNGMLASFEVALQREELAAAQAAP